MEKKFSSSIQFKVFILVISIASVFMLNSCQENLPINPVLSPTGKIFGTVIDKLTSDSIPKAEIRIYRIGTDEIYKVESNNSGYFEINNIKVLPQKMPFRVIVYKSGYQTVDTTINCGCDGFPLNPIPLTLSVCGITHSPDTLYFLNTTVGAYKSAVVKIENTHLTPVSVSNIVFSDPHFKLSLNSQSSFVLGGLQTKSLLVEFTPTDTLQRKAEMKFQTNCSSNPENFVQLVGTAIFASCAIVLSDTTGKMLGDPKRRLMDYFINKTCTVVVTNNSSVLMTASYSLTAQSPTTQILLDTSNVLSVFPQSPETIPPGQSRDIIISVGSIVVGDVFALFSISTNPGGCTESLPLWVQFYEQGYSSRTLYRWSEQPGVISNPYGIYKGFDFQDSTVKNDYSGICQGDINYGSSEPKTTDIRFDGINIQGNQYYAKLKSFAGMQLLGNNAPGGSDEGFYFSKQIWMPKVNLSPNFVWDYGCSNSFYKVGDIIAVRFRNFSTYGLIRIDGISFTVENYERVDFSFIRIN